MHNRSRAHWLLGIVVALIALTNFPPASAQSTAGTYCVEILRQGVYDYYLERSANSSISDIREAMIEQTCSSRSSAAGVGVSVGYGPLSVGGNSSRAQANAQCRLFSEANSSLIGDASQITRDIATINPTALSAFNQCMALSGKGLETIHTAVSRDVFSLSLRSATLGASVKLQRLGMSEPGAFVCRGSLAAMAVSGGMLGNSAVNMVCTRQVQRDASGDLTASAPHVVITVESDQGILQYDFPQLTLPVQRAEASVPIGTILPFAGDKIPDGWLLCNGRSFPAADYQELAAVLGVTGAKSTFAVPDLRGRFLRGVNDGAQDNIGRDPDARKTGSFQDWATAKPRTIFKTDQKGSHNHRKLASVLTDGYDTINFNKNVTDHTSHEVNLRKSGPQIADDGEHEHSIVSGGDAETRPANVATRFIIHAGVKRP